MPSLYHLLRPLIFRLDPETAHGLSLWALRIRSAVCRNSGNDRHPALAQNLFDLDFPNPVGLAAGYDKDAKAGGACLGLGFGFVEAGSITPEPQPGNPRPRLFRLAEDEAIINRFGFNSGGHRSAVAALKRAGEKSGPRPGLLGINIGANKNTKNRVADYVAGYRAFAPFADYITVNISSPNTPNLRQLQSDSELVPLLAALNDLRQNLAEGGEKTPPLLLKIAPDLVDGALEILIETAITARIDGLVISNTTLSRPPLKSRYGQESGGLSGKPLFALSTSVLARAFVISNGRMPLIGVGGIGSGRDAYDKITAGASLVQLYSALVYEGPGLPRRITDDLAVILENEGYQSITEAIGTRAKDFL